MQHFILTCIDIVTVVLAIWITLSLSDFTAWFMIKIPYIGKMTKKFWENPLRGYTALILLLVLILYFGIRSNYH